jgi:molybdopterin converting factor small subunit
VIHCTVELFGVARLLAHVNEVPLAVPAGATLSDVYEALAIRMPVLVGRVIHRDRDRLVDGCACNVNGLVFARTPTIPIASGDRIVILPADAGG